VFVLPAKSFKKKTKKVLTGLQVAINMRPVFTTNLVRK